jgi:hypothetical protein
VARTSERSVSWPLLVIVALCLAEAFFIRGCINERQLRSTTWSIVTEGTYDHADYGTFDRTWQSSHGAVHHVTVDTTIVFFDDGRTCAMEGRIDMPLPKGTRIRILKNGYRQFKVEKIVDP